MNKIHIPVMLNEVIDNLKLSPGKVIVDATIGTGGHSLAILEKIMPGGRLIGIDRDQESLSVAKNRLRDFAGSCEFVHGNFSNLDDALVKLNIKKVDGIMFDLGISTFQLSNPERGFSFQDEGPLDMRLDRSSSVSALDLVNNLTEQEISNMLWTFGQERWHNRIARLIVYERDQEAITTTSRLRDIVARAIPYRYRYKHQRIHPATRTFQAVRIAVNREIESLELIVEKAINLLHKQARTCIISFHSLEDRIVKFGFRHAASRGLIEIVTRKPLTPQEPEIRDNPSSRSAKLRVAERI